MEFDELVEQLRALIVRAESERFLRFAGALRAVHAMASENRVGYGRRLEPPPSPLPTRLPMRRDD